MTTTIDTIAIRSTSFSNTDLDVSAFDDAIAHTQPDTIVLQPNGALDAMSSADFQKVLETALATVAVGVIVDLLWVDAIDTHGIAALAAGVQQSVILGKVLTFQSMDVRTRLALEHEWYRQRDLSFGPWSDLFKQDLEQFLDSLVRN